MKPEFISSEFAAWAEKHNILIDYIQPGCPYQKGYVERFNRTYREGVLDMYLLGSLNEVRHITDDWMKLYNYERPHDGLNDLLDYAEPPARYIVKEKTLVI